MGEDFKPGDRAFETPVDDVPAWTPRRKLSIVTVGAGYSALIFAHKLQHQHPEFQDLVSHTIYESRSDIGGTWLVNRYPGVQCDVPAHVYVSVYPECAHLFQGIYCQVLRENRHFHLIRSRIGVISTPLGRRFTNT